MKRIVLNVLNTVIGIPPSKTVKLKEENLQGG